MTGSQATFLLLSDARMPTGGHAHSGGLEEAVGSGRVRQRDDLASFLAGRLATSGLVDASLAAAASRAPDDARWALLDREAAARCPSPALREVARAQGRRLLRLATRTWGAGTLDRLATATNHRPIWSVALGAIASRAGLSEYEAASMAAAAAITGPAWAAVRVLSLDPFDVAALLVALAPAVDATSAAGLRAAQQQSWEALPALSAPLLDLGAELHARWEVRLFAS